MVMKNIYITPSFNRKPFVENTEAIVFYDSKGYKELVEMEGISESEKENILISFLEICGFDLVDYKPMTSFGKPFYIINGLENINIALKNKAILRVMCFWESAKDERGNVKDDLGGRIN